MTENRPISGNRSAPVTEAAAMLVAARVALRLFPFRRLASPAVPPTGGGDDCHRRPADPRALGIADALDRAARRLPGTSTCLARALAGRWMLRRRGLGSVLHLGVSTRGGALAAHAWLEAGGGIVCGGSAAAGYAPLASFATISQPDMGGPR